MKNLSVTTFIHVLFSVAISILIATFLLFLSWNKDRQKIEEFKRYQLISITFLSNLQQNPSKEKLQKLYTNMHVSLLSPKKRSKIKKEITKEGNTIFSGGSSIIGLVRVFAIKDARYIYIQSMGTNLLVEDNKAKNYNFEYAIAIGFFLIALLLLIYLAILKKLYPLKRLHKQIQKFAQGNTNIHITYKYDDEIGKIAKSFDDAIMHIKALGASRNLFMRNVMHELKTPITKGRIVIEMLEDTSTKEVLVRAFERMNELISELGEVERITTKSFEPRFEHVMLSDIIQESQKLLMIHHSLIHVNIQDMKLISDKKLMVLVIKNLLDNGIKYAQDQSVTIQTKHKHIEIISKGVALTHPLSYYVEPFSQEEKRSAGFGLGLYIVDNILKRLGCTLDYKYEHGNNIFIVSIKLA